MRLLYLIRHASPAIQPGTPAPEWVLSERGVEEAQRLAEVAAKWGLRALYTSHEAKARSTALIIGDGTALMPGVVDGFEELRFDEWINNADAFSEAVRDILMNPDVSLRGAERADAAAARFAAGVELVAQGPFPAAVVSHGRIITAYLAQSMPVEEAFALWRSIPMPGWCAVDLDAAGGFVREFAGLE